MDDWVLNLLIVISLLVLLSLIPKIEGLDFVVCINNTIFQIER